MQFSEEQKKVLKHEGSCLIIGVPGSGKTTLLVEKAAELLRSGVSAKDIRLVAFSERSSRLIKTIMQKRAPVEAPQVHFGTVTNYVLEEINKRAKAPVEFMNNSEMRDTLKMAMEADSFKGSLSEAGHIVKSFKAQPKKAQESEKHFSLLNSYQNILKNNNLVDKHDLIRKHVIGMRNETLKPCSAKYLLVDNLQDATQLQMLWIQEHLHKGTKVFACGNDDLTAFSLDGALGGDGLLAFCKLPEVTRFDLIENYRVPKNIAVAINKSARLLQHRIQKKELYKNNSKASMVIKNAENSAKEYDVIIQHIKGVVQNSPKARVGIIVRQDYLANRILHMMQKSNIKAASYARLIWEKPSSKRVISMLYVLLNKADNKRLKEVLLGVEMSETLVDTLFEEGLQAVDWLPRGALLPASIDLSGDILQAYGTLRCRLLGYWQVMQSGKVRPREVFKAAVYDLLPYLSKEAQEDALLAMDILLSLKGKLVDILPKLEEKTLPDMSSNIIVAPVREVRNMEFDHVIFPFSTEKHWPNKGSKVLGDDLEHERRLFYLAVSRTKGDILFTHSKKISPFVKQLLNFAKI